MFYIVVTNRRKPIVQPKKILRRYPPLDAAAERGRFGIMHISMDSLIQERDKAIKAEQKAEELQKKAEQKAEELQQKAEELQKKQKKAEEENQQLREEKLQLQKNLEEALKRAQS